MRGSTVSPTPASFAFFSSPLGLAVESIALSLAAFAGVQLLLWFTLGFDVLAEAFGGSADHVKTALAVAVVLSVAAAAWQRLRGRS